MEAVAAKAIGKPRQVSPEMREITAPPDLLTGAWSGMDSAACEALTVGCMHGILARLLAGLGRLRGVLGCPGGIMACL